MSTPHGGSSESDPSDVGPGARKDTGGASATPSQRANTTSAGNEVSAAPEPANTLSLFAGFRTVSLLTFLSRVLGLVRDMGMAALFGNGPVMDAFSVAFRMPNLARRMFGEGALTAAFLPMFIREYEQSGRESAWRLASAVLAVLAIVLGAIVVVAEIVILLVIGSGVGGAEWRLLLGLTAVQLPYLVLICVVSQISAVQHALGHFAWPALVPVLLNVVWVAGIWFIAPWIDGKEAQAYMLSALIVVAGVVQLLAPWPTLRKLGFRFDRNWRAASDRVIEVGRAMLPVLLGLSLTQLNTLVDSLIAWGFAAPVEGSQLMRLPGSPQFPLEAGTASALYFGQRMYQFPLGLFGVALGTVMFPMLSRHAEQGRMDQLRQDLSLGLKLVTYVGIPAGAGLVLLAHPITTLFFQRGAFNASDAQQTSVIMAGYSLAVWAYCGLLIVNRGYYAVNDRMTPLRIGMLCVTIDLGLSFTLMWFMGGLGLAVGTSIGSTIQMLLALWFIQERIGALNRREFAGALARTVVATAVMSIVCVATNSVLADGTTFTQRTVNVVIPFTTSVVSFVAAAWLLRMDELWLFVRREKSR